MRYFPQLETLTAGQYPLTRERQERVIRHESLDGRLRTFYDGNASRTSWRLHYEGLSDQERAAIDQLFGECEGRLQTFTFLDPAANLLRWSEDVTQPTWAVDPQLVVRTAPDDPWNMMRASWVINNGAAPQKIAQTIKAPGMLQYCFSAYAGGSGNFLLRIDSGGVIAERSITASYGWLRYNVSAKPGSASDIVTFSVVLPPGQTIKLTGLQAEAQPAAGGYRRTNSRCGVYLQARFADDQLTWTQHAPNNNAAEIRIESRPS